MGKRRMTQEAVGEKRKVRKLFSCPDCGGSLTRVYLQNSKKTFPTASDYLLCQSCQKLWRMRFERVGG